MKAAAGSVIAPFSFCDYGELIALTAALVLLAGGATISSIMRFDPTKILSKEIRRNNHERINNEKRFIFLSGNAKQVLANVSACLRAEKSTL
jgi:hypothetical protein